MIACCRTESPMLTLARLSRTDISPEHAKRDQLLTKLCTSRTGEFSKKIQTMVSVFFKKDEGTRGCLFERNKKKRINHGAKLYITPGKRKCPIIPVNWSPFFVCSRLTAKREDCCTFGSLAEKVIKSKQRRENELPQSGKY